MACATVYSWRWKIDAANTASAPPTTAPSTRCSRVPTPPEATTGTPTRSTIDRVELEVEPVAGPVAVHRRDEDLAGPEGGAAFCPRQRVLAGLATAAVGEDLPSVVRRPAPGVDGDDDALGAELVGQLTDQPGIDDGRRVQGDLVGAGAQQGAGVVGSTHAPAHGEGDEHLGRGAGHHVHHRVALVRGCGDVEEHELIGALGVIACRQRHRVTGVHEVEKAHALHDAPGVDVETGITRTARMRRSPPRWSWRARRGRCRRSSRPGGAPRSPTTSAPPARRDRRGIALPPRPPRHGR